jgi:RNA polymerase sigma-70 factor, ECF subfamily
LYNGKFRSRRRDNRMAFSFLKRWSWSSPGAPFTAPPERAPATRLSLVNEEDNSQLPGGGRVRQGVSSLALDRGMLTAASSGGETVLTDAEFMLRVKEGDDAAFDYLVQKFRRPLIGFMYRMTHNASTAEELAQEVFLRVYRSRATYTADAKFSTWLYRIATNLAANHARDTRHERPEVQVSIDEPDEESGTTVDVADTRSNVEQDLVREERLKAIRKHIQALPERQRNAVIMHKYQNLDYKQIADVLKLSESATKSLLFRAYETLRERLKEFI